jgi:hypothetical protein
VLAAVGHTAVHGAFCTAVVVVDGAVDDVVDDAGTEDVVVLVGDVFLALLLHAAAANDIAMRSAAARRVVRVIPGSLRPCTAIPQGRESQRFGTFASAGLQPTRDRLNLFGVNRAMDDFVGRSERV